MAKAATNHFFKRLAGELEPEHFTVVCYHPVSIALHLSSRSLLRSRMLTQRGPLPLCFLRVQGVVATSLSGVNAGDQLAGVVAITPQEGGKLA